MKSYIYVLVICLLILVFSLPIVNGQDTGVFAEAVGQANLRAMPNVESELVGDISVGIRYPVIGRSEFYPWVLLGERDTLQPKGWVFDQLVTVYGNVFNAPISNLEVGVLPTATYTPFVEVSLAPINTLDASQIAVTPLPSPTLTPTVFFSVMGRTSGEVNVRYGPGVEYDVVGRAFAGEVFEITGYHTQMPWIQIRYEASPNGQAWLHQDLLEIEGDIYSVPAISTIRLNLPTLTPTPAIEHDGELSPEILALGDVIWNMVLSKQFIPGTGRFGAIYLQDLQTGETLAFNSNVAFSGTSINKVPIVTTYFGRLDGDPNEPEAIDIANTMICSENVATNRILGIIGNGDQIAGAENTTAFLQSLGLNRTYLTAPYEIPSNFTPTPPPRAVRVLTTSADQTAANPNPTNQMTVDEMGELLADIYQCGYNESGPLIDDFEGSYTPQECRKILHVMSNNTVDALLKAGVPEDIQVAHKHGWIADTHGNAAVIFTPGGDYVLVMMLFQPEWLVFTESLPLIADVSRMVYNHYNPTQTLEEVREGYIPETEECNYTYGDALVSEIASPFFLDAITNGNSTP